MANVKDHYDGSAPTYHEQYDPERVWEHDEYPSSYFRLLKVIEILRERGAQSVYELGAGEASPIIAIKEALGVQICASDLSPEMVRLGRENLDLGLDPLALLDGLAGGK